MHMYTCIYKYRDEPCGARMLFPSESQIIYVYVRTFVYICVYVYVFIDIYMFLLHTYIYEKRLELFEARRAVSIWLGLNDYLCMYVYICVYLYLYKHIYIYIYIYT